MTWPETEGAERRTLQNFLLMSLKSRWAGLRVAMGEAPKP